jgi:hypothetical protein
MLLQWCLLNTFEYLTDKARTVKIDLHMCAILCLGLEPQLEVTSPHGALPRAIDEQRPIDYAPFMKGDVMMGL